VERNKKEPYFLGPKYLCPDCSWSVSQ